MPPKCNPIPETPLIESSAQIEEVEDFPETQHESSEEPALNLAEVISLMTLKLHQ